jgi:hypothetical protein
MLQHFNEKNRNILININGKLLPRGEAGISPFDSTVQGGDAVWEGLRVYQGRIFKLTEHLDRLRGSARALAFDRIPSHEEITEQISSTLAANGMTDGVHIRLTLSRGEKITSGMDPRLNQSGPTLIVLAEHKPPVYDKGGLSLTTSSVRRFPPDCLDPKIHHCNLVQSILAKIEANAAGADDALMLDWRRADAPLCRLPGGDHAGDRARSVRDPRHPAPREGPLPDRGLPRRRDVLHRNDGRAGRRHRGRRPHDRRRQRRADDEAPGRPLCRAHGP